MKIKIPDSLTTERQRQEYIARRARVGRSSSQVFEHAFRIPPYSQNGEAEIFRAIAIGEAGALRVLNAERPGQAADYIGALGTFRPTGHEAVRLALEAPFDGEAWSAEVGAEAGARDFRLYGRPFPFSEASTFGKAYHSAYAAEAAK